MRSVLPDLERVLDQAIQAAFPTLPASQSRLAVHLRESRQIHSDFQSPSAMKLASLLRRQPDTDSPTPGQVASRILSHLPVNPVIGHAEAADNGMLLFQVSRACLARQLWDVACYGVRPPAALAARAATLSAAPRPSHPAVPVPDGLSAHTFGTKTRIRILVDFSGPNLAREMHIGHLRSTIIGESLCRMFEFVGYAVLRVNHVGDWSTQFGMLICQLEDQLKAAGVSPGTSAAELVDQVPPIGDLGQLYRDAKIHFDEADGAFARRSREALVRLQSGDPRAKLLWQAIVESSRRTYTALYRCLDVTLEDYGESFYNPMLDGICGTLAQQPHPLRKGTTLAQLDDGALLLWVDPDPPPEPGPTPESQTDSRAKATPGGASEAEPPKPKKKKKKKKKGKGATHCRSPLVVRKPDGGYGYDTADLAAIYLRLQVWDVDRVVYVDGSHQLEHFDKLFAAARLAGWVGADQRLDHAAVGLVLNASGQKIQTGWSTSRLIKVGDLLDSALEATRVAFSKHDVAVQSREVTAGAARHVLEGDARDQVIRQLGYAIVRYADLTHHRTQDYVFSGEKMTQMRGNTALYQFYAYVRACSIKRKRTSDYSDTCLGGAYLEHVRSTFRRPRPRFL